MVTPRLEVLAELTGEGPLAVDPPPYWAAAAAAVAGAFELDGDVATHTPVPAMTATTSTTVRIWVERGAADEVAPRPGHPSQRIPPTGSTHAHRSFSWPALLDRTPPPGAGTHAGRPSGPQRVPRAASTVSSSATGHVSSVTGATNRGRGHTPVAPGTPTTAAVTHHRQGVLNR